MVTILLRKKIALYAWGDRRRTSVEVCDPFNEAHQDRPPIARSTVSKIINKYRQHGHVHDLVRAGHQAIKADTRLDIFVKFGENLHFSSRQIGHEFELCYSP